MARTACFRVEACILAGGLSTRMGRDKARLRIGGKSLLAHARSAAAAVGLPVRVIRRDCVPRCGPLGGVFTALSTTDADGVLFLSCDMPFVPAAGLRRLIAALRMRDPAMFYASKNGYVGFPFLLRSTALEIVAAQIQAEELSLQSLAGILRARTLPLPRSEAWRNLNTPADVAVARAAFQRKKPRRITDRA